MKVKKKHLVGPPAYLEINDSVAFFSTNPHTGATDLQKGVVQEIVSDGVVNDSAVYDKMAYRASPVILSVDDMKTHRPWGSRIIPDFGDNTPLSFSEGWLNTWAKKAYSVSSKNGFHDKERPGLSFLEYRDLQQVKSAPLLILSEVMELFEALRSDSTRIVATKNEGVFGSVDWAVYDQAPFSTPLLSLKLSDDFFAAAVRHPGRYYPVLKGTVYEELADIVIRCLDMIGSVMHVSGMNYVSCEQYGFGDMIDPSETLNDLVVRMVKKCVEMQSNSNVFHFRISCALDIISMCDSFAIRYHLSSGELKKAIGLKHYFNQTRTYKHGKVL